MNLLWRLTDFVLGAAIGIALYRMYPHALDADYWGYIQVALAVIGGIGLVCVVTLEKIQ
jgi:hypothetical protein